MKFYSKSSFLFLLLFTTGCSTLEQNSLANDPFFQQKPLVHNHIVLPHINIYQSAYGNSNIIKYEYAQATVGYKFNYSIDKIVTLVFPNYTSKIDIRFKNFTFFTMYAKKNKKDHFYMIVENENKKRLRFYYGFNQEQYDQLQSELKNNKSTPMDTLVSSNVNNKDFADNSKSYFKSNWNIKNIILDILVVPVTSGLRGVKK